MNVREARKWLNKYDNEHPIIIYMSVGDDVYAEPNMGYATMEEVFNWQDQLDNIDYSNQGIVDLYLLTEEILDVLESRFELNPNFVKEIEEERKKIESGDTSDYVKIKIPERSFFDLVNSYCDAEKIGDVLRSCAMLIDYVQNRVSDVECDIHSGRLWIKPIGNASCSTSILSTLLKIDAKNIDDSQWESNIWSIHLYRR